MICIRSFKPEVQVSQIPAYSNNHLEYTSVYISLGSFQIKTVPVKIHELPIAEQPKEEKKEIIL